MKSKENSNLHLKKEQIFFVAKKKKHLAFRQKYRYNVDVDKLHKQIVWIFR